MRIIRFALAILASVALVGGIATNAQANGGAMSADLDAPGPDAATQPADPDFPGDPPQ